MALKWAEHSVGPSVVRMGAVSAGYLVAWWAAQTELTRAGSTAERSAELLDCWWDLHWAGQKAGHWAVRTDHWSAVSSAGQWADSRGLQRVPRWAGWMDDPLAALSV